MKQGTVKTLGAVALGAAIAATGAGTASAAPVAPVAPAGNSIGANGVVRDAATTLSGVTSNQGPGNDIRTPMTHKGNQLLGGLPTSQVAKLPIG
ncbi:MULTISPECIES: hypothetical protein [Streptomyces]|uniref:Small secreted domain n=1 Tax=Streptomyces yunnanensis TaxID=156453 RepID=A0ABY8A7E3_9ACTN|nr:MULTISPECIES: hypothetical protein [Streptomyces]AJC56365.1 hypothetical protein GZL_03779 [Streptomyces sp. 769]WEB40768.1 hypothetical protein MOV08_16770 [Streptomyces yunnanensis]